MPIDNVINAVFIAFGAGPLLIILVVVTFQRWKSKKELREFRKRHGLA